jgi:signal peptidase I
MVLWVNRKVIQFDGPTTYVPDEQVVPVWSEEDPGDLEPAGIGSDGAELAVSRIRMFRDVYYVASAHYTSTDYDYEGIIGDPEAIHEVLSSPEFWAETPLFESRRESVQFDLQEDQFFPMGDNSPSSKDARLWARPDHNEAGPEPFVERRLLTGKALLVYWPHPWNRPIPYFPNFQRMGLIR